MPTIKADTLRSFVRDIFVKAGCSEAEGTRIGKYLVSANLCGHDSHGVQRVPRYLQWKAEGQFIADRTVQIVTETPVLAVVDGQYGFGQTVAPQTVEIGIKKAKAMGLSAIGLRNTGHIGRIGDWAEMATDAGLVSIHFVNVTGSVLVAPFGGVDRRFSTAPYCVGVPRPGKPPIILDFATSVVAEGKVLNASFGGKKIPSDAIVLPDGAMTGDPHGLYGDYTPSGARNYRQGKGAIRAFGDHKGSGLAFMCEVLGGALTGSGAAEPDRRFSNGMMSFYLDPAKFDPAGLFPPELNRFIDYTKSARPTAQDGEVLLPGEPEHRMRIEREKNGVPLPADTWTAIVTAAKGLGLGAGNIPDIKA